MSQAGPADPKNPPMASNSAELPGGPPPWDEAKSFYENLTPTKKPKSPKPQNAITIAVSSRALFRMEEEQKIYREQGLEEYVRYQLQHENEPFKPGAAFPFVKALETVNARLRELYPGSEDLFDIVLMTNNHAQVGVRLINTINHHNLFIERFCMTGGKSPIDYLKAYHTNLYLSSDSEKVQEAIEQGLSRWPSSHTKYELPYFHVNDIQKSVCIVMAYVAWQFHI